MELGYQILFISPDRPEKIREVAQEKKWDYVILSDSKAEAAKAFGVAFRVDDATIEKYKKFGIDLVAASGESHFLLPVPSTFIFGRDGKVRFTYADPDYRKRLDPKLLAAAAEASIR